MIFNKPFFKPVLLAS